VPIQVQAAANAKLWDDKDGAFFDNPSTFLHPQDGNSLAVIYGLVQPPGRAARISEHLAKNWNAVGARTPEWNFDIGTFPGSLEVMPHLLIYSFTLSRILSFPHSRIPSFTLTPSLYHPFTRSLIHSFTHSLMHTIHLFSPIHSGHGACASWTMRASFATHEVAVGLHA
jgi:hypothetical protein